MSVKVIMIESNSTDINKSGENTFAGLILNVGFAIPSGSMQPCRKNILIKPLCDMQFLKYFNKFFPKHSSVRTSSSM